MSKLSKGQIILSVTAIVVLVALGVYLYHRHYAKPAAQTTSKSKTAQSNYTGDSSHKSNPSSSADQGGAVDNHGNSGTTPTSKGVTSTSGLVSIVSPASGGTLKSGDTLSGTADKSITTVQYRVIDDQVGVVAQGSLQVVNGAYSGTLHFQPSATTGRVDVYSYNAQYQETNEVQLPVQLVK